MDDKPRYRLERLLGRGGMAEVYVATKVGTQGFERPVAVKRMLPEVSDDVNFAAMFTNEAQILNHLHHPNIVEVDILDRDDEGRLFLAMELVEGKDLAAIARSGQLPLPVILWVITEVLEGLDHAHRMTDKAGTPLGIVHRDVSPHNVLVSWEGAVKVSDFGIAKAMEKSKAAQSLMLKGKPLYMAPEQLADRQSIDQRTDLFAVGVMFYELLTGGRRIYQGADHEQVMQDIALVARGGRMLVPLHQVRPDIPFDVAQVVGMLLAVDKRQRFGSAGAALAALHHTTSMPTRGAFLTSQLLAARFPAELPHRMRSAEQKAAAPTVLAPAAPVATPSAVRRQMDAPTRTVEAPTPVTPAATASATVPGKRSAQPPARGPRIGVVISVSLATAAVAGLVTLVLVKRSGGGEAPRPDAERTEAPVTAVDAAARAATPPDAATAIDATPAIAAPIDAARVDAASRRGHDDDDDGGGGGGDGDGAPKGDDGKKPRCPLVDGIPRCR